MRGHLLFAEPDSFAENDAENQSGPAGSHMNDGAPGEIDRLDSGVLIPHAVHESIDAPDHVRLGKIDDEHPERHEHANGRELHAFGNGADNQCRRDNGEHQLVHRVHIL